MTEDKGILIQNIYYMLSYAFQVLKQENYREIAGEPFENIQDLFAAILAKGIAQQLKRGLYREYIPKAESLSVLRGKLDIQETLHNRFRQRFPRIELHSKKLFPGMPTLDGFPNRQLPV